VSFLHIMKRMGSNANMLIYRFMKPNTLHYVLTVQNSITYGRHFYCGSTMSESIFGVVHSFVLGIGATNTLHDSTRIFLHRIIAMWEDFFASSEPSPGEYQLFCWTRIMS
jgi:hypothetical protein